MNLPTLIQQLYGEFSLTGLFSFEFVDKSRNTITEIFFMIPPKTKNVSEPTRSSTIPTLGSNYNLDAGNATKTVNLSGDLYFPYVGSPDNPVARNNDGLDNTIDGLNEFLKLQWMLVRYRDYTMTKDSKMTVPSTVQAKSKEINTLYKKVSKLLKEKVGCLYDEIQLIYHDYDMDDHYYCRVNNFSSSQSSEKYIVANYTIDLECYERDTVQNRNLNPQIKRSSNEESDVINSQLQSINFNESFENIQAEIGYNFNFLSTVTSIDTIINDIDDANTSIQAGQSTILDVMPILIKSLIDNTNASLNFFIDTFLSIEQKTLYENGDATIDDYVSNDLLEFYNSLQKIKIEAETMNGVIISLVKQDEIRYYEDADDYTLTTGQFDLEDSSKVENDTTFYYYTVQDGDNARIIAQKELNDHEKFISILKINNISENDFIDGNLIGQKIKIPFDVSVVSRGSDNLIFESNFDDVDLFLYGTDLKTDINNNIEISSHEDILDQSGIDNAFDNVTNRILNLKGSLNVFNPNWGTIAIDDSNAPLLVKIDRYLSDVIEQIQEEPRVEAVQLDIDSLKFKDESISASFKVFFIGTSESREVSI